GSGLTPDGRRMLAMLLVGACATPAERERFLREAEAVAGLRRPHIVQVHDVGEHEGLPYFTMEVVGGGSLAEKLAGAPQPACQAAALLATLAEAIHAAHQGGIVHGAASDFSGAGVPVAAERQGAARPGDHLFEVPAQGPPSGGTRPRRR